MSKTLSGELRDPDTKIKRKVRIELDDFSGQIGIHVQGYGDNTSDDDFAEPIVVDMHKNKLQVFLWSDINDENPTHKVDMTGARLDKRVEDHNIKKRWKFLPR
jgi:hypothetical protein